ncbi:MAG: hypothetical protein WC648_01990 [Candidatus Paceibacterota bacterium]|jgi:hypothetical protein
MRKDREQANIMRKSGMSYSEIKSRLGVPLSTLSDWFHTQQWSNDIAIQSAVRARQSAAIRLVVLNTVRGGRLKKAYEDAKQDALVDYSELRYHPLFISGLMLYWAHGDKTAKSRISFSSMDPSVIKIFRNFLVNICGIQNMRVQILLKSNFDQETEIMEFWKQKCGFVDDNFLKSIRIMNNKPINKPYFGVCNIILNSAYLKNKILRWIQLISEDIVNEKYVD